MLFLMPIDASEVTHLQFIQVSTSSAAAVWALAVSTKQRQTLTDLDAIVMLLDSCKRTLKMSVIDEPSGKNDIGSTQSQRDGFQVLRKWNIC